MSTDICWLLGQAGPHPRAHPRGIRSHAGTLSGFNPLDPPILWEGRRTQRGFAPLHTPSGGTHEPKPRMGLIHQAHAEPNIAGRMEHSRIHLCPFQPPLAPQSWGREKEIRGTPPNPRQGRVPAPSRSAPSFCTPRWMESTKRRGTACCAPTIIRRGRITGALRLTVMST